MSLKCCETSVLSLIDELLKYIPDSYENKNEYTLSYNMYKSLLKEINEKIISYIGYLPNENMGNIRKVQTLFTNEIINNINYVSNKEYYL